MEVKLSINNSRVFSFLLFFLLTALTNLGNHSVSWSNVTAQDTTEQKRSGIAFLPIFFYSPETKLAGGAGVNYYFREQGSRTDTRPSTIMPYFIYTQESQILSSLSADTYWKNEIYHLIGSIDFVKFPDKFYGIGNKSLEEDEEDYTAQTFIFELSFQRRIITSLNVGLLYEYVDSKMKEVEEDGLLAKKNISGSEGGKVSGIGVLMDWDTRDNIFYPSSGAFYQISARGYGDKLGSDFSFNKYTLDFRQFFPLFSHHVVGFQGYVSMKTGNPPFQMMSLLGGENIMRGYYLGRYRDKNMIVFQTEYRVVPVWWRFGLVAFMGLGEVSNEFSNFRLKDFKHSLGWGIRYQFNKEEGLNIRLDFGLGKDTSGLYINFLEAF